MKRKLSVIIHVQQRSTHKPGASAAAVTAASVAASAADWCALCFQVCGCAMRPLFVRHSPSIAHYNSYCCVRQHAFTRGSTTVVPPNITAHGKKKYLVLYQVRMKRDHRQHVGESVKTGHRTMISLSTTVVRDNCNTAVIYSYFYYRSAEGAYRTTGTA